jgi:hypothetical protein
LANWIQTLLELCLDSFLPKFLILLPSDKNMTFWPLIFLLPKIFKLFGFSNILTLIVTWWRLFHFERHLMKVIPLWSSPDEGYSTLIVTWWRLFHFERHLMKVIPLWASPDEGYSRNESCALNLLSTFLLNLLNFFFFRMFLYLIGI